MPLFKPDPATSRNVPRNVLTEPRALKRLLDLEGDIDRRVFETRASTSTYEKRPFTTSFHPKAYIFRRADGAGVAFVGSSNLSRVALSTGIEWNYRIVSSSDASGFGDVLTGFETLFAHPATRPLDDDWIDSYSLERKEPLVRIGVNAEFMYYFVAYTPKCFRDVALLEEMVGDVEGSDFQARTPPPFCFIEVRYIKGQRHFGCLVFVVAHGASEGLILQSRELHEVRRNVTSGLICLTPSGYLLLCPGS